MPPLIYFGIMSMLCEEYREVFFFVERNSNVTRLLILNEKSLKQKNLRII